MVTRRYTLNLPGWMQVPVPFGAANPKVVYRQGLLFVEFDTPVNPEGFTFADFFTTYTADAADTKELPSGLHFCYMGSCEVKTGEADGGMFANVFVEVTE